MKDTFNGWSKIGTYHIDSVVDYILTGRKADEAKFDAAMLPFIGNPDQPRTILDFGCGIGRNTFGLANVSPLWTVTGYDNEYMISRREEYHTLHYRTPMPSNAIFSSEWDEVKTQKFDVIVCWLVLQHIYEDALAKYLSDFKHMTHGMVICGRRINDDPGKNRSTWTILQENGWTPSLFLKDIEMVAFTPEGESEEHHIAIYENTPILPQ